MQNIKTFLDEDYTNYAVYRTYQRLPHILDSLGQTQRKILYVMEGTPSSKKVKTAEVYSYVYSQTQYLHGDASVYTVVENLARSCSNNINLLTEEGSFGYRTDRSAASPRYTSTRFSKIGRLIFNSDDKPILASQEFEGKTIEPEFLLPIIPVSLVNGYSAIAVGFASKILPRNPLHVIDAVIDALTFKKRKTTTDKKWDDYKIQQLVPDYPFYNGQVIPNPDPEAKSSWIQKGILNKTSKNTVTITDLPPEATRESYLKKIKRYIDKGIVKSYTEKCGKNTFIFKLKLSPEYGKNTEEELYLKLGLVDQTSENFTFINPKGLGNISTIHRFDTAEEYLKVFIEERQKFYEARKEYQLNKLVSEISVLTERVRFISEVNSNHIIITKRKKIDLEKELALKKYDKIENSFDHLLGMKMYSLTEENIKKYQDSILLKENEYTRLLKTPAEDLHIDELKTLRTDIASEMKSKGLE